MSNKLLFDKSVMDIIENISKLISGSYAKKQDCIIITTEEAEKIQDTLKFAYAAGILSGTMDSQLWHKANNECVCYEKKYKEDKNARL